MDYKEYARQLRENAAKDDNGIIRCSPELWEQIASIIETIPIADVVEVKHAQIVRNERNIAKMKEFHEKGIGLGISEKSIFWTCSECGSFVRPYYKYCSECGADMRGETDAKL